jgi:putative phosphoribosyl transferase
MAQATKMAIAEAKDVRIRSGTVQLHGDLSIPANGQGVVLFVHGSGSSRHSPRNQFVARAIREAGVGTLLFDVLTEQEEAIDKHSARLRFDIRLLAERLILLSTQARMLQDISYGKYLNRLCQLQQRASDT